MEIKPKYRVLIIEDDAELRETTKKVLERRHYMVSEADSVRSALVQLRKTVFHVVLLDLKLPDGSGLDILKRFSADYKNRFIIISGTGTIGTAVEAMKEGAFDFLEKSVDRDVVLATLEKALEVNRQLDEFRDLKREYKNDPTFSNIIFESTVMRDLLNRARQIAGTDNSVLISGETGTGKELFAHAVHNASMRKNGPFIPVNCATISKDLAESELFGFERGAFTGAHKPYPGKFGLAEKGSIFLDEIGEISENIQAKLLRVLESGEIFPLRSNRAKKVDVRIIAASNRVLEEMVREGTFRDDLFFRIDHIKIHIPPLRERKEDIIPLANYYLRIAAISNSRPPKILCKESKELFTNYPWPGNVRELKNTLYSIAPFIASQEIRPEHLPLKISKYKEHARSGNRFLPLKRMEKKHIVDVLRAANFNILKAAKILEISRSTLYKKIENYGIEIEK